MRPSSGLPGHRDASWNLESSSIASPLNLQRSSRRISTLNQPRRGCASGFAAAHVVSPATRKIHAWACLSRDSDGRPSPPAGLLSRRHGKSHGNLSRLRRARGLQCASLADEPLIWVWTEGPAVRIASRCCHAGQPGEATGAGRLKGSVDGLPLCRWRSTGHRGSCHDVGSVLDGDLFRALHDHGNQLPLRKDRAYGVSADVLIHVRR